MNPLQNAPKEFIIKAESISRIYEIMEMQVPLGPSRKIEAELRKLRPYSPPAPPKEETQKE